MTSPFGILVPCTYLDQFIYKKKGDASLTFTLGNFAKSRDTRGVKDAEKYSAIG